MREYILSQVQDFMHKANLREVDVDTAAILECTDQVRNTIQRRFKKGKPRPFGLSMSSVGRPLCQLQKQVEGADKEPDHYSWPYKALYGDIIEATSLLVMEAAGVDITSKLERCELHVEKVRLGGIYDVAISDVIFDVKSVSNYAWDTKFNSVTGGFMAIHKDDPFGYICQGYGYAEATGKRFGGWIVINKETGHWDVIETPANDAKFRDEALETIRTNVLAIKNKVEFKKQFEDVPETYMKKPTGNRILGSTCSFCGYKKQCWPEAEHKPSMSSRANTPPWKWYTHIEHQSKKSQG